MRRPAVLTANAGPAAHVRHTPCDRFRGNVSADGTDFNRRPCAGDSADLPETPVSTTQFRALARALTRPTRRAAAAGWWPSRGSPTRSEFQRDRDRIVHATAFRRLKHKTQVFVFHEGDHFRTRLTHTIEVAQIARALARALGLDEDLAEALALVARSRPHALRPYRRGCARRLHGASIGGFDHNAQALRIVTRLEQRYADFDGLNLTWETLEGLVKHNGPLLDADGQPSSATRARRAGRDPRILRPADLELATHASAEAQAAAIADDIAYNAHDIDDGLRAGLFDARRPAHGAVPGGPARRGRRAHGRGWSARA